MRRVSFAVLVAGILALAIPASASASGSPESSDGGNCSSSGAIVAANCTNISGPQVQAGGGLENTQQQNNTQQNGDNSGTSNANTDGVATSQPSESYEGSESSGSGGNCSQNGALIAANCTNISGGQYQGGAGLENQQQQNNNQQNGNNSGTSNANTTGVAYGNSQPKDSYEEHSESQGGGGNCQQKFAAVAANCTNISKGQEQSSGGIDMCAPVCDGNAAFVPGGGSSSPQQQNNNQQNGNNSGTSNTNTVVAGHGSNKANGNSDSWSSNETGHPSGGGRNCNQSFAALAINCSNYSGGQYQGSGSALVGTSFVQPGGSAGSQQQNNNQQNGNNAGTENTNTVVSGHGPRNGDSNSWSSYETEQPSGGGRNCNQSFVLLAANCTNISKGQWQSSGGGREELVVWPGSGSSGSQQQNNNQQNGNNAGTENTNTIGASGPRNGNSGSWSNKETEHSSGGGRNCNQSFVILAANCTNYSGGQWQSGGGEPPCDSLCSAFVPGGGSSGSQQQNNNQQNGNNSGTENSNSVSSTGGYGPWKSDGYREPEKRSAGNYSAPSGGGGNCNQSFAFIAANCTNYSGGQWQTNDGRRAGAAFDSEPGGSGAQQQNNNQQNGNNAGTENTNTVVEPKRARPRWPV
jgi:hypothetical protein